MRVIQITNLTPSILEDAAAWYAGPGQVPRVFRGLPPTLLRTVTDLSGGAWTRCTLEPDGSVVIHNRPAWRPVPN